MKKSNFQLFNELRNEIKDDETRHKIVFFDTLIGSYTSRKNNKDLNFKARRITSDAYESECIAKQRQETLNTLKNGGSYKVLKKLSAKALGLLKNGVVEKEGLYVYC